MAAPTEYTIANVVSREEWSGNDGPMVTYELLLAGEQQVRKGHVPTEKDPGPAPGSVVSGWADKPGKFSFATGGGGKGRGGGGGGGAAKTYDRSPDHPLVMQQRLHTSALSTAVPVLNALLEAGLMTCKEPQDYFKQLERTASRIKQTYPGDVLARAETGGDAQTPAPAEAPQPEQTTITAAAPAQPQAGAGADADIPF